MKYLSAYTVMLTINLEPVYGIVLAYAILGDSEQMTTEFYIGAVVILTVIIINGIIKTKFKKKKVSIIENIE
jgi:drug/metabolite transporter (DMT)-like permease